MLRRQVQVTLVVFPIKSAAYLVRRPFSARSSFGAAAAVLGIRAEDARRTWERRAPLSPEAVQRLRQRTGARVIVQRSEKRIWKDEAYAEVGAELVSSSMCSDATIVLGIKETPKEDLTSNTTYVFFSHTHKGQPYNLPLLRRMLDTPNSRYIDWELLKDSKGVRTTAFGWYAGYAGMLDGLSLLGTKLLATTGWATPLLRLPRPHQVTSVEQADQRLKETGESWNTEMARTWRSRGNVAGPVTVVISGKGRVGQGAKSVLDALGVVWIPVTQLKHICESPDTDMSKIYAVQLELRDWLTNTDGRPFDREEYRHHPGRFVSRFATSVAPYTTLFLNAGFWEPGCPRIMTTEDLAQVQRGTPPDRFLAIVDVGCDWGGALEFVMEPTTVGDPTLQFDATTGQTSRDPAQINTTQITSIEIYPTTLPLDSSQYFSDCVLPYVETLMADPTCSATATNPLAASLRRAIIVEDGKLATEHEKLYALLESNSCSSVAMPGVATKVRKKVVLLGSGLVAGPAVKTLAARGDIDVVIASDNLSAAQALASGHSNAQVVGLDATNHRALEDLVASADIVVSLLPASFHVHVAKSCIRQNTSLITASYVSPEMRQLHLEAEKAGVILLNELGLDPGIDHASAMKLISDAIISGNKIMSFVSFCGGLPSPELSNGPLGYKFSWSPRGVLTAALNSATFRFNTQNIVIKSSDLLDQKFSNVPILRGFSFEGVANRNSIAYLEEYGLPADLPTILRGTLRYPGFAATVDVFKRIGLLDLEVLETIPSSWSAITDICLRRLGFTVTSEESRLDALRVIVGDGPGAAQLAEDVLSTLKELNLAPRVGGDSMTHQSSLPPMPKVPQAPIDLLSTLLGSVLAYAPKERDAVVLHHELCTSAPDGEIELFTSTLVQYGTETNSAMATTVGVPIALGALLCLDGKISSRGVVSPASPEVWKPLLSSLERHSIAFNEVRRKGVGRGIIEVLEKDTSAKGRRKPRA